MVNKSTTAKRPTSRPASAQQQHEEPQEPQEPAIQQAQEAPSEQPREAFVQLSQPTSSQPTQPSPSQQTQQSQTQHSQTQLQSPLEPHSQTQLQSPAEPHSQSHLQSPSEPHSQSHLRSPSEPHSQPQPNDSRCSALSSAPTIGRASKKRRTADPSTTFADISDGSSSEPELKPSPPVLPPKGKRGPRAKRTASRAEAEFSSLMTELVTLPTLHAIAQNEIHQVSSSASDAQQRALALRVQGMGLANENLAANTKEQYTTYLRLFRDFCNETYAFENDLRFEVYENKVLVFFKDVMFKRTTPKVFRPGDTKDVRMAVALAPPETNAARRPVDLRLFLKDVVPEADNTKILLGLCEGATMDQALKALVHLQTRQIQRIVSPNKALALRGSMAVKEILAKYSNDLVYGELVNHRNWSASCAVRNTYSIDEHLRCLLDSWQQPVSASSPSMKLHLSLAIRHSMMLRDEDLRGVSYSDIFIDPAANLVGGTQNLVYLMFAFHRGKTNQSGKLLYGTAVRHSDVRRCSVGALGFYFYDLFHVKNEPPPDFDDPNWVNTKLLHNWPELTTEVSYEGQRDATSTVFQRQHVSCRHITHSGRHSGSSEAKLLRIRREDIRKAGRWIQNTSKMDAFYDDDPSYSFGLEMAGFLGGKVPFHLKRNEVVPSLELQRQIFPFIETACGSPGSPEYEEWQKECVHEMEERNANDSSQLSSTMPLQYDPNVRGVVPRDTRQSDLAKKCFLKALLRLRRAILQDAGEYLYRFKNVKSPLLELGVFATPAFKVFKEQMEAALDTKDVALPMDMHPNVKHVLQNQQNLIVRQGEIMSRVPGNLESMGQEVQRLRSDTAQHLDQAMLYWDAKFDYGMSFAMEYALRMESKMDYLLSRIGPHGSWLPCAPPLYGYNPHPMPPPAFQHQYEEVRSTARPPNPPPRGLAPVSMTASAPPRWTPVSHQPPMLQGATQTMTTTETTTTTTATTATTTTSLVMSNLKVNYRLQDVADICAEVQQYDQEIQKAGKKKVPTLERKHQKQVSNKRHVLKEVEYLAAKFREEDVGLGEEAAFHRATSSLNVLKQTSSWSVNQLIDYCRAEKMRRDRAHVVK